MSFRETFTYREQFFVTQQVCGNEVRFYPTRYAALGDLAKISKPMATALTTLFVESGREEAATTKNMKDADGLEISEVTVSAITPELAEHKSKERKEAVDTIFSCIEDINNRLILGKLLMDSMRDEFPYKRDRSPREVTEWLEGSGKDGDDYTGIDIPTLTLLIGGFIKANAKSFGPQGESLVGAVKAKLSVLRENSPSAQTETAPTSGATSKTASSQP